MKLNRIDPNPPKGTFDIYFDQVRLYIELERRAAVLFELYGYSPIETPIFESTELFTRGIGESTDIVEKEMYTFTDKGNRSITLRPEGTAPVVRAYLGHPELRDKRPLKVWYSGAMFRYERPQAGRYRQFFQLGVEVIGADSPEIDAETIELLYEYFRALGLTGLDLLINTMGCGVCRPPYIKLLQTYLDVKKSELCDDCNRKMLKNPLRVFDCKVPHCRVIMKSAPHLEDHVCEKCAHHFHGVKLALDALEINYRVEFTLVRGFDYYTGTTFEIQSRDLGAQNALGGGGRYDDLIEQYGGGSVPAVGFALGMERLILALEKQEIDLLKDKARNLFYIAFTDDEEKKAETKREALKVITDLRRHGIKIVADHQAATLKAQMKQANRSGATHVIIRGPEEEAANKYVLKDMQTGDQRSLDHADLLKFLQT